MSNLEKEYSIFLQLCNMLKIHGVIKTNSEFNAILGPAPSKRKSCNISLDNQYKQTSWVRSRTPERLLFSSVAIFQNADRMEFTFHNSCVILELVPCTVIVWTELSYCRKSYSNKAALLLYWSPWQSGWLLRHTHILNDNWSFTLYIYGLFCFLYHHHSTITNTFTWLDCI